MDDVDGDLRAAVFAMDIRALQESYDRLIDAVTEKRSAVDSYLKMKSVEILRETKNWNEDVRRLLDFCFEAASKDCASKTMPVLTLTDIFEVTTIDKCEKLFEYVEEKTPQWKTAGFIEVCRTQLLRMCNDLLRRLSRTIETEFCGRILIFLARCLPLTEKSGLNLTSQFNVDNVTKFDPNENEGDAGPLGTTPSSSVDEQSLQKVAPSESMEVEEGETDVAGGQPVTMDYNMYVKFWQLQSYFASPNTCYEKFRWRQCQHNANEILNAFQLLKLDPPSTSTSGPEAKKAKTETASPVHHRRPTWAEQLDTMDFTQAQQRSTYFAKYLTSQRLLHLQFNDSTFRRYILVQFLVLFQYLTSDVKFKDKRTHVLSDEQMKWIEENAKKCYDLLAETYPHGEYFVKVVQRILGREENWSQWKNSGCNDFTQRTDKEKMLMFKKRQKARMEDKKFDLGNPTLTALWNVAPDNFEACRTTERKFVPELEAFFDEAIEQLDPDAGIEEKYKIVNDETFQWRALRVLCMKTPHFVQPTAQQVTSISSYLTGTCEKLAEDIPKYKNLKEKSKQKNGTVKIGNGNQDSNHQQESEIVRTDTNAEEEAEFRAQNFDGPGEQVVTVDQIENLSSLIGSDWVKLAQELEMPDDSIAALKKKQIAAQACSVILTQWCDSEGAMATVKRLRNILLKAELFNEDVSAILSTSSTSQTTNSAAKKSEKPYIGGRVVAPLKTAEEETEVKPAKVSTGASSKSSVRNRTSVRGDREATPVQDERKSTASNM